MGQADGVNPTTTEALRRQLRHAREAAGLTRRALGDRLGITENQVFRIEKGARSTSIERAQEWLVACGFSVETVSITEPERAALAAAALGMLDEADLQKIARVIRVWSDIPEHVRDAILMLAAPHEK